MLPVIQYNNSFGWKQCSRAFSLAGAFSIIRLEVLQGTPKRDITYIFFTLAVGLTCGMGYIGYAFIFTIILCSFVMLLNKLNFAIPKNKTSKLKITIPEDLKL